MFNHLFETLQRRHLWFVELAYRSKINELIGKLPTDEEIQKEVDGLNLV